MGHGIEDLKTHLRSLEVTVTMQDFLKDLGVGAGRGSLSSDDPVEETLTGQALRALPSRRIHEDVGVDQDHE
jgi:hypothetical protein